MAFATGADFADTRHGAEGGGDVVSVVAGGDVAALGELYCEVVSRNPRKFKP